MNEPTTNDRWVRVMGMARQHWDKLTDDDLAAVRGNSERLISALQTRYGIARAQALQYRGIPVHRTLPRPFGPSIRIGRECTRFAVPADRGHHEGVRVNLSFSWCRPNRRRVPACGWGFVARGTHRGHPREWVWSVALRPGALWAFQPPTSRRTTGKLTPTTTRACGAKVCVATMRVDVGRILRCAQNDESR